MSGNGPDIIRGAWDIKAMLAALQISRKVSKRNFDIITMITALRTEDVTVHQSRSILRVRLRLHQAG